MFEHALRMLWEIIINNFPCKTNRKSKLHYKLKSYYRHIGIDRIIIQNGQNDVSDKYVPHFFEHPVPTYLSCIYVATGSYVLNIEMYIVKNKRQWTFSHQNFINRSFSQEIILNKISNVNIYLSIREIDRILGDLLRSFYFVTFLFIFREKSRRKSISLFETIRSSLS